jgi:hypothetical protein
MVVPNLQNPVKVTISRIDISETEYDPVTRENINIIRRRPPFNIDAQIVYRKVFTKGSMDAADHEGHMGEGAGGVIDDSDGYVLLRVVDLAAQSLTINDIIRGDSVTKLGQLDVDYYVMGKRPAAHYTDQGGFTMVAVFFEDRNP